MTDRTITSQNVEARAFFGGARKVRHFDTVAEADAWLIGLTLKHAGCATEIIAHQTEIVMALAKPRPAAVEFVPHLDVARTEADRD